MISLMGYTYSRVTNYNKTSIKGRWICSTHYIHGCRAVLHTIDNEIVKVKAEHNHDKRKKK